MSRNFRDAKGESWTIELNFGNVMRVKANSEGRFNLLEPDSYPNGEPPKDSSAIEKASKHLSTVLKDDLALFYEVLFLVLEPQAIARDVSAADFGQRMAAECIHEAQGQFFAEWADFFRGLQRHDQAVVLEKLWKYHAKGLDLIRTRATDPRIAAMDEKAITQLESTLKNSFSDSLENLDLTLDRLPSAAST